MSRGVRSPALALAAAVLLTGCGGGDEGGDPSAFAARADVVCKDLATAVGALREDLVRATATSEPQGLSTVIARYGTAVRRTADELAATRPPRADRRFRDDAVAGLRRHARAMERAAAAARAGRGTTALKDELRGGALPTIPAAVVAGAPACHREDRAGR